MTKRNLKAFVRFDGSGRIVAGSLILRKKMPKVGKWQEIPAEGKFVVATIDCCAPPTPFTCMTYAISVARGDSATYSYTDCATDRVVGPTEIVGPSTVTVCAKYNTVVTDGGAVMITPLAECEATTTTTTTSSTTTTTTTTIG